MSEAFDRVVAALHGHGSHVVQRGDGRAEAQCPHHEDNDPSLSLTASGDRVLIWCHAGCSAADVVGSIGLTMADLYDQKSARYAYDDGREVRRYYDTSGNKKKFSQKGAGPQSTLYRAARVRDADPGREVFLVEGEADVHAIESAGGLATTAPQGAGSFHKVDAEPLRGRSVIVVVDRDAAGDKWAEQVADKMEQIGAQYRFVRAAEGKDASDHLAAGYGLTDFEPIPDDGTRDTEASVPLDEGVAYSGENLWEGMTEGDGHTPRDDVYGDDIAPHVSTTEIPGATEQEAIANRYRLPEEFWGARELFKTVRQAAWASQTHPDAVLACVLARAAGAAGHGVSFDTGKSLGTMSLFACLLAPSGVGKSDAYKAATRLVKLPSYLTGPDGTPNMDVFRDGLNISTGEGLAEVYMGTVEQEATNPDGSVKFVIKGRGRNAQPEVELIKVRKATRHRAFFFVDEGEALTKLMHERSGATLGPHMRTAWSGGTLSQANASEERYRFVPGGSYTMGLIIGYQPDTAVAMLSDVGPGTPQRFLWFGAQDTEMPDPDEEEFTFPEAITLPAEEERDGIIQFPREIRQWFRRQLFGKHRGTVEVDPMDAHEPLMRAKLSALLCWLDGRALVNRDDWVLAGMLWSVSTAIRDRLIRHRNSLAERDADVKRESRLAEAAEIEVMRVGISAEVEQVARRIAKAVAEGEDAFQPVKRYRLKKDFGRQKAYFDAGLAHARSLGWIAPEEPGGCLETGISMPS